MHIDKQTFELNGETCNILTHNEPFYGVGYDPETLIVQSITPENAPIPAGTKVWGQADGFGNTVYTDMMQTIESMGLILPQNED